jgi:hypothetical protein
MRLPGELELKLLAERLSIPFLDAWRIFPEPDVVGLVPCEILRNRKLIRITPQPRA